MHTSRGYETSRIFAGAAVILALVSPFLILFASGVGASFVFDSSIASVFGFTFAQAFLSALLALALGLAGSFGLEWVSMRFGPRVSRWSEAFSVLPNFAPVLIFLLAAMKFLPFARGFFGIVLVHALLNSGLVSVAILRAWRARVAGLADLAWIEGASRVRFFLRVAVPMLRSEFVTLFLFVFAICFTSFGVPLVIGGSRATTVEVLIWQLLRIDGAWSEAIGLAILQIVSILALTVLLRRESVTSTVSHEPRLLGTPLLSNAWGLLFAWTPSLLLIGALLDDPLAGASRAIETTFLSSELLLGMFGSVIVSMGTGLLVLIFLSLIAYSEPRGTFRRALLGYAAPSSVITGFAVLIAWREVGTASYIKIMIALTLVIVPAFYRLRWDSVLNALDGQRIVAASLGATRWMIFSRIVLPQVIRPACFIAGLASFWAWGDFGLSRVIAERDLTIAMTVQSLMGSYRLDIATFLVWIVLIGGAITFSLFEGVGRVLDHKS